MRKKTNLREKKAPVTVLKRGVWNADEDQKLVDYVPLHGEQNWRTLAAKAGLNRCGKSCRLRWLNYLRPGIKRGNISEDEEELIIRLHNLLGNRWSLIAGRLPGRTDNEIKNYWKAHLAKKSLSMEDLNRKLSQRPSLVRPIPTRLAPRRDFTTAIVMTPTPHQYHLEQELPLLEFDVERWLDLSPSTNVAAVKDHNAGDTRSSSHDLPLLATGESSAAKMEGCSGTTGRQAAWDIDASEFDGQDKFIDWEAVLGFLFSSN